MTFLRWDDGGGLFVILTERSEWKDLPRLYIDPSVRFTLSGRHINDLQG